MSEINLNIDNVYSYLTTTDTEVKSILARSLRFRPKNFWMSKLYKTKKWDGFEYFFNEKSGRFLTGLIYEIKGALKKMNRSFNIIDSRVPINWAHESIDEYFLNSCLPDGMKSLTLHDYQPDMVNQSIKYGRGVIQVPTGGGKTFCLISILKCLPPKTPVLFLTKSSGLVHQNYMEMQKWGVPDLGRWYDKYKEPNYVMCCTIHNKTFENLEKLLPKFKVLIVDEVHDCVSKVPVKAYKEMKSAAVRIGISATAFRWYKKKIDEIHKWTIKSHFGPIFKTKTTETGIITTKDLQARNIISPSDCHFYKVDKPDLVYEPYQDAVKWGVEQNFHFHKMVADLAKSCSGRTLIVTERIEQGNYLQNMIPGSEFIQGKNKLKEKEVAINSLKLDKKFVGIVMRQIITAGIDVKLHNLINASGGDEAHNIIQLMGRGLRNADDKSLLRYHDFMFVNNDYLKDHSEWRVQVLEKEGHKVTIH